MHDARRPVEPRDEIAATIFILSYTEADFALLPLIALACPDETEIRRVIARELKLMRRRKAGHRARRSCGYNRPVPHLDWLGCGRLLPLPLGEGWGEGVPLWSPLRIDPCSFFPRCRIGN